MMYTFNLKKMKKLAALGKLKVGDFNDMQDKIAPMTQHERVLFNRERRAKRLLKDQRRDQTAGGGT